MVTITDQRIRNTVFESVYDLLNGDKANWNAVVTPSIIGGHPNLDTVTFPIVIINPIDVSEDDYTIGTSDISTMKTIAVIVEVYTSGKNAEKDLDNIADGISYLLRNTQITGIFLNDVQDSSGLSTPNNTKIKQKTLTFTFMRR